MFEENSALDSSFQPYWSDYFIAQGLLTGTSLSTEKKTNALSSNTCNYAISIRLLGKLEIVNVTFIDIELACDTLS